MCGSKYDELPWTEQQREMLNKIMVDYSEELREAREAQERVVQWWKTNTQCRE